MAIRKLEKIILGRAGAVIGFGTAIFLFIFTFRCWTQGEGQDDKDSSFVTTKAKRDNINMQQLHLQSVQVQHEQQWQDKTKSNFISCFLFVIVLTTPEATERRKAIRKTWMKLTNSDYKVVVKFVLGIEGITQGLSQDINYERKEYNDLMILPNHRETYRGLATKLLKAIVWVNNNVKSEFLMKVDDDSFVRLELLAKDLDAKKHLGRLYWGFFRGNSNVKWRGAWSEEKWILCDHYLPYALGGGYIITTDLVKYITSIANMLQLYNSEDVSLGTWLAPVRLNRIHDVRFDTEYKSRGCNNKHIVSHKQTTDDMITKYNQLQINNTLCKQENQKRLSFEYNWAVKPSQCCERKENIP